MTPKAFELNMSLSIAWYNGHVSAQNNHKRWLMVYIIIESNSQKSFFLCCSVHEHSGDDVRWNPSIDSNFFHFQCLVCPPVKVVIFLLEIKRHHFLWTWRAQSWCVDQKRHYLYWLFTLVEVLSLPPEAVGTPSFPNSPTISTSPGLTGVHRDNITLQLDVLKGTYVVWEKEAINTRIRWIIYHVRHYFRCR